MAMRAVESRGTVSSAAYLRSRPVSSPRQVLSVVDGTSPDSVRPERSEAESKGLRARPFDFAPSVLRSGRTGVGWASIMAFSLYILECADGSLYIGHTDDLDLRLQQHDTGAGGYTVSRCPLKLLHVEEFETRYEALTMERKLKGWSRAKKLAWIRGDWQRIAELSKGRHRHERT